MEKLSFGQTLKNLRKNLGLSQADLAARVPCSTVTIKKIEADERRPSQETALLLARALRVAPGEEAHFLALARGLETAQPPSPLPLPPTVLVDRHTEHAQILEILLKPETHLLTLTGPGGVGKTRLALQAAQSLAGHFPDGIYLINLASVQQPELFLPAIALAFELTAASQAQARERLHNFLQDKSLLLVLDNFEQILPAASEIAAWLEKHPGLKLLVTSRASLHLRSENEYPVPPMGLPDLANLPPTPQDLIENSPAVDLFVRRVRAARPGFNLSAQNLQPVAEICVLLDGLPLALELAAARCKILDPLSLLAQLKRLRPLNLLTGGQQDLPQRQQTIRATLDWSYNLLEAPEQALFTRMGIFVGGASLEAVEAICAGPELSVLDSLAHLVDHSLIWRFETEAGQTRFQMLATLREYTLEKISQTDELETLRQRQASFFAEITEQVVPLLRGGQQKSALRQLTLEHENLRAVLDWCCATPHHPEKVALALQICAQLWEFWIMHGDSQEASARMKQVLALPGARQPSLALAQTLNGLGLISNVHTEPGSLSLLEEALALFRQFHDSFGEAWVLEHIAQNQIWRIEDKASLLPLLDESLRLFESLQATWNLAWVHHIRAHLVGELGQFDLAYQEAEQAYALFIASGDQRGQAWASYLLGMLREKQGNLPAAIQLIEAGLELIKEVEAPISLPGHLCHLSSVQTKVGLSTSAWENLAKSLAITRHYHDLQSLATTLIYSAEYFTAIGQPQMACNLLGAAEALLLQHNPQGISAYEQESLAKISAPLRQELGDNFFQPYFAVGKTNPQPVIAQLENWPRELIPPDIRQP